MFHRVALEYQIIRGISNKKLFNQKMYHFNSLLVSVSRRGASDFNRAMISLRIREQRRKMKRVLKVTTVLFRIQEIQQKQRS